MKKTALLLLFVIGICFQSTAQTYKIDTSTITFEKKQRPCLMVQYDASPKTVKKALDEFLKKNNDLKVKGIGFLTNKEILTGIDVSMPAISDKRMNLYLSVTDAPGDRSELKYFTSFGYDFFHCFL